MLPPSASGRKDARCEWWISDRQLKIVVRDLQILKAKWSLDICSRVELLCDATSYWVELGACKLRPALQRTGSQPKEIAGANGRLQNSASAEAKALCNRPDRFNDLRGRIVRVSRGRFSRPVFFGRKQVLQFLRLCLPAFSERTVRTHKCLL